MVEVVDVVAVAVALVEAVTPKDPNRLAATLLEEDAVAAGRPKDKPKM